MIMTTTLQGTVAAVGAACANFSAEGVRRVDTTMAARLDGNYRLNVTDGPLAFWRRCHVSPCGRPCTDKDRGSTQTRGEWPEERLVGPERGGVNQ